MLVGSVRKSNNMKFNDLHLVRWFQSRQKKAQRRIKVIAGLSIITASAITILTGVYSNILQAVLESIVGVSVLFVAWELLNRLLPRYSSWLNNIFIGLSLIVCVSIPLNALSTVLNATFFGLFSLPILLFVPGIIVSSWSLYQFGISLESALDNHFIALCWAIFITSAVILGVIGAGLEALYRKIKPLKN